MGGGKGEFGLKPQKSHSEFGGGVGWPEGGSMGWRHFTTLRPAEVLPSTFKCDFYPPSFLPIFCLSTRKFTRISLTKVDGALGCRVKRCQWAARMGGETTKGRGGGGERRGCMKWAGDGVIFQSPPPLVSSTLRGADWF
jgi:hypothetical protein